MAEPRALVWEDVLEELLASEVLEVGIVDPALADAFVGQAVDVLELQQPDHKAGLDAGSAVVAVERRDLAVYPGPVDLAGKLHQLVLDVDDLVEPGPEQIALSCCRALLGSHCHPPLRSESRMHSQENRQKRNRKIPPPHGAASCDSKSPSRTETDSRSTPYEFFAGDRLPLHQQILSLPPCDELFEKNSDGSPTMNSARRSS